MRSLSQVDQLSTVRRRAGPFGDMGDETCGNFLVVVPTAKGRTVFRVIATSGEGWDHVSVSLPHRCPTWDEMSMIAGIFFEDHERLVQYRPPASEYVNNHPYCLHWWRPLDADLPHPPAGLVGISALGNLMEAKP